MSKILSILKTVWNAILSAVKWVSPYIVKFLKWLFGDIRNLILVCLAIAAVILYFNYKSLKSDYENVIIENSLAKDSLAVYRTKTGELYEMNTAYVTDIENLKKSNTELYNQIKDIKDNVITVEKINYVIKRDTIYIETPIDHDTADSCVYRSNFVYTDKWSSLKGSTVFNTCNMINHTQFDDISFNGNIYTNLIERDGQLYIIAKSDNPYFKINNLDSYMVSPEDSKTLKKRFVKPWGISAGVGASVSVIDGNVKIIPALQVTVGYQFIRF